MTMYSYCMFMYGYPDWGFPAFSSVVRQIPRQNPQRRDTARTLPNFCVVECIVCFVSFSVLFLCKCVLYYCHRVATQLQLNIYHIISYHIISYHIISYHIISYHISYHIIQVFDTKPMLYALVTISDCCQSDASHICKNSLCHALACEWPVRLKSSRFSIKSIIRSTVVCKCCNCSIIRNTDEVYCSNI